MGCNPAASARNQAPMTCAIAELFWRFSATGGDLFKMGLGSAAPNSAWPNGAVPTLIRWRWCYARLCRLSAAAALGSFRPLWDGGGASMVCRA